MVLFFFAPANSLLCFNVFKELPVTLVLSCIFTLFFLSTGTHQFLKPAKAYSPWAHYLYPTAIFTILSFLRWAKASILGPFSLKFPSISFQKRSSVLEQSRTYLTEQNLPNTAISRATFFALSLQKKPVYPIVQLQPDNSYSLPAVWHIFIIITAKEHIPLTAVNIYHPYLKVLVKTYTELNQFLEWAKWFSTQLLSVQHSFNFISNEMWIKMCTVAPIFPNNWTRQPITKRNHSNGFSTLLDKVDCFQFSVNKMYQWNRHLSWIILLQ